MASVETQESLIAAAIACIERKGLRSVTSRDIVLEAGANLAAINYHFGTKDRLIQMAMRRTVDNGMERFEALVTDSARPLAHRLHDFFVALLVRGAEYPNISRAHLYPTIIEGGPPGVYLRRLSGLVESMLASTTEEDMPHSRVELSRRIEIALRGVLMQVLHPKMFVVTPQGASGVEDEVRRLLHLVLN